MYIFKKKTYDFYKIFLISNVFKISICIPFQKFNSNQKKSPSKIIHFLKQSHSVQHEFYLQFSFATNEQV